LVGLLLAVSRGAWLGLAAGAVLALYLAVRSRGRQTCAQQASRWRAVEYGLLAVLVLLVAAIPYLAVTGKVAAVPLFDASTSSRPELWRWGLDLVSDYPFTGSGLGSTMMVQATYVMMLHVGFISHMHNLLLQIAIEQGIPGLIAFAALVVLAIASLVRAYRSGPVTTLFSGAVAALTALLVHGAVDAGIYVALTVPLLFLPIGFALGLAPAWAAGRSRATGILASATAALALVLLLLSPERAAFLANLGAVAQTRAELSRYTWPDVPIQDALRRSPDVDLAPAVSYYRAALALDPANAAANRRLGQIEMSRGEYDAAREHLAAAYRAAPGQQASRFLLGESLAIGGQVDDASVMWQDVGAKLWWDEDWIGRQVVNVRRYWYDSLGEKQRAEYLAEAAALAAKR
jgi:tetratricopeptide (TPR) repeat protein